MPHNEGFLNRQTFGGESVYTQDHQPIILSGQLKTGHGDIKIGSVLVQDTDGINVIAANNALPIIGVSDEDIVAGAEQAYVSYVAHGTVKSGMLKGADGTAYTDTNKLQTISIYAL